MSNMLEEYLVRKAEQRGEPIKATLELTPLCNIACKMCYIRHTSSEVIEEGGIKPFSFWKQLIPGLKELGVLFVAMIGGEVFTIPWLENLYRELYRNGFYVNLTTNGTMLADGIPGWLAEKHPRYITVSLYGASDKTYQMVTGCSDGFSRTMKGIENLQSEGINTKLNFLVTNDNVQDLEPIIMFAKERNMPVSVTAYNYPCGIRNHMVPPLRISPEKAAHVEIAIRRLTRSKDDFNTWLAFLRCESEPQPEKFRQFTCRGGNSAFWISWKGSMSACGMLNEPKAELCDNISLADVWPSLKKKTKSILLCEDCAICRHRHACGVCPAIMYSESGSFTGKPGYMCRFTNELIRLARTI